MDIKKKEKADVFRSRGMYLNIGLVVALVLVISAFQWRTFADGDLMNLGDLRGLEDELWVIPPTTQPPPPKPKLQQPKFQEVEDDEEIEDLDIIFDVDINEDDKIEEIIFAPEDDIEIADEIFDFVEDQPAPVGGMTAFYKFLKKNLKYPSQARRMGIEGQVFVKFVVDKDGSLTDIKIMKGIGAGCDEEAIRVLKAHPKWSPGRQRGREVKVRMVVPIFFKLGSNY